LGDLVTLRKTAFVITLDTDTRLPRDAGRELIGALAHPLNRPRYDARLQRITEGYAILQPRVAIHLPSARRSWFVRIFAGEAGTDPYTLAVSDVYQDLFAEGSFIGKGIYDVDAFMTALDGHLPDNLILSHDLIEGCFARSGLVSDVLLYEDHPSHLLDDGARRRRWTRGDWQILYWVLPWSPGRSGVWRRNPLSALSRWKIIDNLRRSMVPLAMAGAVVPGLLFLEDTNIVINAVFVLTFVPALLAYGAGLVRLAPEVEIGAHLRVQANAAAGRVLHAWIALIFLPEDCRNSVDAIARTAVRMFLTHRNLLEWRSGPPPRAGDCGSSCRRWGRGRSSRSASCWRGSRKAMGSSTPP
jgi:cyclic beta-1,2-glucan synthetase